MKRNFDNEMKLEFISKSANEAFARIAVAAFVSQLDPTIEELADIKTAVSEAVTNCIIHGYEDKQGIVKIKAKLKQNQIIIEISDQGKGIENINFMDSMEVQSIVGLGTKIIMTKTIEQRKEKDEEEFEMLTKD